MTDPAQARMDDLVADRHERLVRAALIAHGYDPPPHVGQRWVDPDGTLRAPAGHREVVKITAIGKTITGWQLRVRRHLVNGAGEDVDPIIGEGLMYLDHLLTGYRGQCAPYQPLDPFAAEVGL